MSTTPHLRVPPGACDTHMHIYEARFAFAPTATIKSPPAPVSAYCQLQKQLGLERVVGSIGFSSRSISALSRQCKFADLERCRAEPYKLPLGTFPNRRIHIPDQLPSLLISMHDRPYPPSTAIPVDLNSNARFERYSTNQPSTKVGTDIQRLHFVLDRQISAIFPAMYPEAQRLAAHFVFANSIRCPVRSCMRTQRCPLLTSRNSSGMRISRP